MCVWGGGGERGCIVFIVGGLMVVVVFDVLIWWNRLDWMCLYVCCRLLEGCDLGMSWGVFVGCEGWFYLLVVC